MPETTKIVILGAGAIGTALGNALAVRTDIQVCLLSIEADVVRSIDQQQVNPRYFPNILLNRRLTATTQPEVLRDAELIFLALPSAIINPYLQEVAKFIPPLAILVNLAKGFGHGSDLIPLTLSRWLPNPICVLKGPSFAREIINNSPTAFTLASADKAILDRVEPVFDQTILFVDRSSDCAGVEYLSILKNIYAVIIGIVDAHFNSPNLRFMMFTRAFAEMRQILLHFGGKEETMFCYCGIGDFGLTSLNDLSRNRTLGLLIGKGFFDEKISDKVVLEGRNAMKIFLGLLEKDHAPANSFWMMKQLESVFSGQSEIQAFVDSLITHRD